MTKESQASNAPAQTPDATLFHIIMEHIPRSSAARTSNRVSDGLNASEGMDLKFMLVTLLLRYGKRNRLEEMCSGLPEFHKCGRHCEARGNQEQNLVLLRQSCYLWRLIVPRAARSEQEGSVHLRRSGQFSRELMAQRTKLLLPEI